MSTMSTKFSISVMSRRNSSIIIKPLFNNTSSLLSLTCRRFSFSHLQHQSQQPAAAQINPQQSETTVPTVFQNESKAAEEDHSQLSSFTVGDSVSEHQNSADSVENQSPCGSSNAEEHQNCEIAEGQSRQNDPVSSILSLQPACPLIPVNSAPYAPSTIKSLLTEPSIDPSQHLTPKEKEEHARAKAKFIKGQHRHRRQYNVPKPPTSPFGLFLAENYNGLSTSTTNRKEEVVEAGNDWMALSEARKEHYRTERARLLEEYRQNMIDWKLKMVRDGKEKVMKSIFITYEMAMKEGMVPPIIRRGRPPSYPLLPPTAPTSQDSVQHEENSHDAIKSEPSAAFGNISDPESTSPSASESRRQAQRQAFLKQKSESKEKAVWIDVPETNKPNKPTAKQSEEFKRKSDEIIQNVLAKMRAAENAGAAKKQPPSQQEVENKEKPKSLEKPLGPTESLWDKTQLSVQKAESTAAEEPSHQTRPQIAMDFFAADQRANLRRSNQPWMSSMTMKKVISEKWSELPTEERQKYELMASASSKKSTDTKVLGQLEETEKPKVSEAELNATKSKHPMDPQSPVASVEYSRSALLSQAEKTGQISSMVPDLITQSLNHDKNASWSIGSSSVDGSKLLQNVVLPKSTSPQSNVKSVEDSNSTPLLQNVSPVQPLNQDENANWPKGPSSVNYSQMRPTETVQMIPPKTIVPQREKNQQSTQSEFLQLQADFYREKSNFYRQMSDFYVEKSNFLLEKSNINDEKVEK